MRLRPPRHPRPLPRVRDGRGGEAGVTCPASAALTRHRPPLRRGPLNSLALLCIDDLYLSRAPRGKIRSSVIGGAPVMSYRLQWLTALITLTLAVRLAGAERLVPSADLKESVARALPPLTKGAAGHRENKTCFACHNQALPIMAITAARERGVA